MSFPFSMFFSQERACFWEKNIGRRRQSNVLARDLPTFVNTIESFLAEHDCTGKAICPFNMHGGSGFAVTLRCVGHSAKAACHAQFHSERGEAKQRLFEHDRMPWPRALAAALAACRTQ